MSKYLKVGDVHQTLRPILESQDAGVEGELLTLAKQYWSIPAIELNEPTAAYYSMELFDKLDFSLGLLFEHIPDNFQFWDLHASEKLENALIGNVRPYKSFLQIAEEKPAWLHSISGMSKKPRLELLRLLILRNCHLGISVLADDLPVATPAFLAPRERIVHPYLEPEFDILPGDEVTPWSEWLAKPTVTKRHRHTTSKNSRDSLDHLKTLTDSGTIQNAVLNRRILSEEPESLEAIGKSLGLTRERIRQIEVEIRSSIERWISETPELAQYRAKISEMAARITRINAEEMMADLSEWKIGHWTPYEIVMSTTKDLHHFGAYVSAFTEGYLELLARELTKARTEHFGRGEFFSEVTRRGFDPDSLLDVLKQQQLLVEISGELFFNKETLKERALEILSRRGEPMEVDEIFRYCPAKRSLGTLRNLLFSDPSFTRTSKHKVGLASWGLEPYSTIQEEIAKALDAKQEVGVDELTAHLVTRFEVSASSVHAYASTWPFEIRNGKVVRSRSNEIQTNKEPSEERNLWRPRGHLIWATKVTSDHIRGSGSSLPRTLCKELGLSSDKDAVFKTVTDQFIRVGLMGTGWAIGSIRRLLEQRGLQVGDWCFFIFKGDVFDISKTSEDDVERFQDLLSVFLPDLDTSNRVEFEIELKSMLFLPETFGMPSVFSALKSRDSKQVSDYLQQFFPQNLANEIADNHSRTAKFVIKSVE